MFKRKSPLVVDCRSPRTTSIPKSIRSRILFVILGSESSLDERICDLVRSPSASRTPAESKLSSVDGGGMRRVRQRVILGSVVSSREEITVDFAVALSCFPKRISEFSVSFGSVDGTSSSSELVKYESNSLNSARIREFFTLLSDQYRVDSVHGKKMKRTC